MEGVRAWVLSICAAMVICGIVLQIMPRSNLSAVFKLVVSVFFLCCLLSPVIVRFTWAYQVTDEDAQFLIQEKADKLQNIVSKQVGEQANENVKKNIAEKLEQMGIKYYDIAINITTNGQSDSVDSVDICLDKIHEPEHGKIAVRLESALQLDVRLEYAEKESEYAGF